MITGLEAAIDGVPCIERFRINLTAQDNAVACSDSAMAVLRSSSNKDWNAVVSAFGHTPAKLPNDKFTFTARDADGQGWRSETNGAIVRQAHVFCRPQSSEPFYYHLYISGNGSLTPGEYSATGGPYPTPASSIGRGVSIDDTPLTGIAQWELILSSNLARPIWPAHKIGWPVRDSGNIDAEIVFRQHPDLVDDLPEIGDEAIYNLFVTDTLSWEIKWGKLLDLPVEYVVRNQNNEPEFVAAENRAHFSASVGGQQGHILKPGAAQWWPFS